MTLKKRLLVILGSGSSIPVGMPSVPDLNQSIKEWSEEWASQYGPPNFFTSLWDTIAAYYQSGDARNGPAVNFEKVLGEMIALAHWMEPAPWGDTLRATACPRIKPPSIPFPMLSETDRYGATVPIIDQLSNLLARLAKYMREKSRDLDTSSDAAQEYKRLLDGLRETFEVGVYNLNYDVAALSAWPDAFTGFGESGQFNPASVHLRKEWAFIYHLHGSVHHSFQYQHGGPIYWRNDLTKVETFFDDLDGRPTEKRSEGKAFPQTTLIAGGHKLDQLLVEPFHSLHAALTRHIYEADAILIGGYGFGDIHINRVLQNRYGSTGTRLPIMVLDFADCKTDPMTFREDAWSRGLSNTLTAPGDFFLEPGHPSPPNPLDLAVRNSFEVSKQHRVALWHGGFTAAASRLDGILPWLEGEPDELLLPPPA
jgi:hypothetical protein